MSVKNFEKLEKSMVVLTVEVSAADFEAAVQKAYLKQRGRIQMPGFRPGKAAFSSYLPYFSSNALIFATRRS